MSYIPLECQVCCKAFSGPIPAQDHFHSRDHLKKMETSKFERPGFACDVCNKSCDTRKILQEHFQSPRHKAMAEKQHNFLQSTQTQTGSPNLADLIGGQGKSHEFSKSSNTGKCHICNVLFTSLAHAQSHLEGKQHKKKHSQIEVMKSANLPNQQPRFNPTPGYHPASQPETPYRQLYSQPPGPAGDPSSVSALKHSSSSLNCDICLVPFTGPESAQQHYASEKHKKKVNQGVANKPTYACSLCDVTFTGPENEATHKLSQKHMKNVKFMEKKVKGEVWPLFCEACNSPFTGQECAESHFKSKKHRRNIENMSIRLGGMHGGYGQTDDTPTGHTPVNEAVSGDTQLPHVFTPIARRQEAKPVSAKSDHHSSTNEDGNYFHVSQHTRNNIGYEAENGNNFIAKPNVEKNTIRMNSEEDLIVKPIERDEDSLVVKPVETDYNTQYRQNDDESLDVKCIETDSNFDSMRDESKIRSETCTSMEPSFESLSLTSASFSSRDTEPVRYVQNDLEQSIAPIGRGRGILTMLRQDEHLLGKVMNTSRLNNLNPDEEYTRNESETWKKSIWSGTRASPTIEATNHGESNRQRYNIQPLVVEETVASPVSSSTHRVIYQNADIERQSPEGSEGQYEMEEYTFDPLTGRGKCYICDIDFTSSKHKSQHILGKNHLKAREVHKMEVSGALGNSTLLCKICCVTFSGLEAKIQHMRSDKHKRKEMRHIMGEENEYYCDKCKISCSGPESFAQHKMGAQHRKMAGISPSVESGLVSPVFDKTKWYPCEICNCNMNTHEQLKIHMESPKHRKQLEKQGGLTPQGDQPLQGCDRTQWFTCDICKVSMNTYQQLKIHEQSPRHLRQLEKQQAVGDGHDRTIWYPCHVCNCQMNTQEQLRIHEASPAHLSKLRKSQGISQTEQSPTQFKEVQESASHLDLSSPLQSFLSEELFPKQFLPGLESTNEPEQTTFVNDFQEQLVMTEKPFQSQPRFAPLPTDNPDVMAHAPGTGTAKRGQGSDLAYLTRSRGLRENSSKGPSASSTADDYALQGARPKQNGYSNVTNDPSKMDPTVNNPYSATHNYYCHTCKAPMNTRESYESHLRGKRHMQKVCTESAPVREHIPPHRLPFNYVPYSHTHARNYQQELYEKAMGDNTLCFLPTGTGKTLVAVMTMSAMLDKYPSKNVLFLVDKVLLVIQQSKYITKELGDREFLRFNPDSECCTDTQRRTLRIAAVCMGQQATDGIPLWKHDIVVVTAAFCKNLLDKQILRWEDFCLVVIDEAHHCEKGHPFNTLLTTYHRRTVQEHKPKILGLTASPAGKADVPKTLQMLQGLVDNMGRVRMTIVEEHENVDTLNEYQSNAEMIIRPQLAPSDLMESGLKHELSVYIMYCVLKLCGISNIRYYIDFRRGFTSTMSDEEVKRDADEFVDTHFDLIQSSLNLIDNENENIIGKVQFSQLCVHVQSVCMALSCLEEGGVLIALQELEDMEKTVNNFNFARDLGLPTANLQQIINCQGEKLAGNLGGADDKFANDMHTKKLIDELTDGRSCSESDAKRISLVLVKQRCTAHLITRMLQKSERMRRLGLNTTCVVGHGGSGAADKGMNVNQQKRVLEETKLYKYQVIVATSVAEEGVDWPECERVISLYPPSTVTALVQMRGRARRKNSKFIVLCASQEEEGKLSDIIEREKNMILATRLLLEEQKKDT